MRAINEDRARAIDALAHERMSGLEPPADAKSGAVKRLEHWRWRKDREGICWLVFDRADARVNTLSEATLAELNSALVAIRRMRPEGLIVRSAKPGGFIHGADIEEFSDMTEETQTVSRINEALAVLDRLADFPAPTVALIHGACLGGGLELALACDFRIARPDASFAFPEVRLGLHPGLAGTWRSIGLIDPFQAMSLMLTGRSLEARKARRAGLVDVVTEERHLEAAARAAVAGTLKTRRRRLAGFVKRTLPMRALSAWQMERKTEKAVRREHYPAPFALIDLWKQHGGSNRALRQAETVSFAGLLAGDTAQNLARVFFLRKRLKDYAGESEAGIAHVHVIGAGTMGGDIAAWSALSGFRVSLQDRSPELIAPAVRRAAELFERRLREPGEARNALDRLIPDARGEGLACADLVIEAVPEDIKIKQAVYAEAEARMRPGAVLATNTSSIVLERLRESLGEPHRFVGLHFFNPVARMPLVEVVTHGRLGKGARSRALAFIAALDKLPLPVKSAPGFLVNRTLMPYLMEALACLAEGTRPETIDAAAEAFGMPMGPIELADQVGLDVCLHVARVLKRDLDVPMPEVPDWFVQKVESGELGRKSGKGFYEYAKGQAQRLRLQASPSPALQDRLVLPLINACVACVRERIVEDADAADAGLVFGAGFAPFRGGPLHYVRSRGAAEVAAALDDLATIHGQHLKPDRGFRTVFAKRK